MSGTTGQKPTDIKLEITVDSEKNTISIIPNKEATIGELLSVLYAAYGAVLQTGQEMVDTAATRVLQ